MLPESSRRSKTEFSFVTVFFVAMFTSGRASDISQTETLRYCVGCSRLFEIKLALLRQPNAGVLLIGQREKFV